MLKKAVEEITAHEGKVAANLFLCFLIGAFDQQLQLTDHQFEAHVSRARAKLVDYVDIVSGNTDPKAQPISGNEASIEFGGQ